MKYNKGQLGNLQGIILALVVIGILLGAGFFILGEFTDQIVTLGGGNVSDLGNQQGAFDGVNATISALATVPDLLPLIVLIAMIVIILALVFTIPGTRQ